ncbi:MAG: 16S rRNA processing protein RimM [Vicingus serpentipes]|nr:16S rRNA processing protein RimM [Vicingus serpentipes]
MNLDACYYLGYTAKVHGKNGELIVKLNVDFPEEYQNLESVFIQLNEKDKTLIPFFLTSAQIQNSGNLQIKIEGIDNLDEAKKMIGKSLYLPLNTLPELTGNQFYYHEVIGFKVIDAEKGNIGQITQVLDYPTQAIFEIQHPTSKEILVPITDEIITKLDRTNQTIFVTSPEGLIDLYLT